MFDNTFECNLQIENFLDEQNSINFIPKFANWPLARDCRKSKMTSAINVAVENDFCNECLAETRTY